MDTSWTASVPSLPGFTPPPPDEHHNNNSNNNARRRFSLSAVLSALLVFKPGPSAPPAPAPYPSKLLLDGVGILADALEYDPDECVPLDINDGQATYTLTRALSNLHKFKASLSAAIASRAEGADPGTAATDPRIASATAALLVGNVHGAVACARFLNNEGVEGGGIARAQAGAALLSCLQSTFILFDIIRGTQLDQFGDFRMNLRNTLASSIDNVFAAVLGTPFSHGVSFALLVRRARALKEGVTKATAEEAATVVEALKHLATCVAHLDYLPRTNHENDDVYPDRFALDTRVLAAELAVSLFVYEIREVAGHGDTVWIEGTQRYVLECISGTESLLDVAGGVDAILAELDPDDWVRDEDEGSSDMDADADADNDNSSASDPDHWDDSMSASDVDMESDSDNDDDDDYDYDPSSKNKTPASLLAALTELTERFLEVDEGFRRKFDGQVLPPSTADDAGSYGEKADIGRSKVLRASRAFVRRLFEQMRNNRLDDVEAAEREKEEAAREKEKEEAKAEKKARSAMLLKIKNAIRASVGKTLSTEQKKALTKAMNDTAAAAAAASKAAVVRSAEERTSCAAVEFPTPAPAPPTPQSPFAVPALPKKKRKSDTEPELLRERRATNEVEKTLRSHGVSQGVLDEIVRPAPAQPAKRPRLSDSRHVSRALSTSRAPSAAAAARRDSTSFASPAVARRGSTASLRHTQSMSQSMSQPQPQPAVAAAGPSRRGSTASLREAPSFSPAAPKAPSRRGSVASLRRATSRLAD